MKKLLIILLLTSCITSQKELTKQFFDAVDSGKKEHVKKLIDKGININSLEVRPYRDKDRTALYYIIRSRNYEMFRFLLQEGADLNFVDRVGRNYLHIAARDITYDEILEGHEKDARIMKYLLKNSNLDINKQDRYKNVPLHYSVYPPQYDIAELLVQHGADVNIENDRKQTPLQEVVDIYTASGYIREMGNDAIRIVHLLMKHGARNPQKALSFLLEIKRNYNKAMFKKQLRGITRMEKVLKNYISKRSIE